MPVEADEVRKLVQIEVNALIRAGGLPVSAIRTPRVMGLIDSAQSIASGGAATPLRFDGSNTFDVAPGGVLHTANDPTKFHVSDAGLWGLFANVVWESDTTNIRQAFPTFNGVPVARFSQEAVSGAPTGMAAYAIREASKGDYFGLNAYQNSGAALDVLGGVPGASSSWAVLVRMG